MRTALEAAVLPCEPHLAPRTNSCKRTQRRRPVDGADLKPVVIKTIGYETGLTADYCCPEVDIAVCADGPYKEPRYATELSNFFDGTVASVTAAPGTLVYYAVWVDRRRQ